MSQVRQGKSICYFILFGPQSLDILLECSHLTMCGHVLQIVNCKVLAGNPEKHSSVPGDVSCTLVTEFCKTLNKTGKVQWSNWQIWQILLSSYRWLCHFRLFETCQFVSKLDSVDSRKKRCWTRASWKRQPVDLHIQRWMRMWQSLDLPGVKPLYDVNAKKARPAKCTRHHWHQDTVHVFLYFQDSQSTVSEKQVWNDQCGC